MSTAVKAATLIAALVELILGGRRPVDVARQFNLAIDDLSQAFAQVIPHTWRGKYAAALATPADRPDLLPKLMQLAGYEMQYQEVMLHYHRAEQNYRQVRDQEGVDLKLIMKADQFSFRVQQAACRLLRDIDRAAIRLEKAQAAPPAEKSNPQPAAPQSWKSEAQSVKPAPQAEEATPPPLDQLSDTEAPTESTATPAEDPQTYSPEEQAILLRYRHRIKHTAPKDRPALIQSILKEAKSRQKTAA